MRQEKNRRVLYACLLVLTALILFGVLYRINAVSPRCSAEDISAWTEPPENGPLLLTGGELYRNAAGEACCSFRFRAAGAGSLFSTRSVAVSINGEEYTLQNEMLPLKPGQSYEVVVHAENHAFPYVANALYYGSPEQIIQFRRFYAQVNAYIQGMCFMAMLLACVLLLFKRRERYLLWLALLCFFRGGYTRLTVLLQVVTWLPGLNFLAHGNTYLVLSELLTAFLQFKIMESFMPVRIGKLPFPWYAALFALPALLLHRQPVAGTVAGLLFFTALYLCYLVCFLRLPQESVGERRLLITFWVLTVTLRFFDEFCELGWMPSGDVNLRFRLRGLVSMLFVAAFVVVVGKRFAQKFQEADDLNVHLEERIREKTRQQTLFVRSMLHNLKTPLFSLSGYSDMALRSMDRHPEQARQYMEKAREKAIFAGELMDHIFLVTQMDADMVHMQSAPVNLGELLKAVAETPTAGQENKNLALSLKLPEEIYVQGDQLYLRQAFQNILDNARVNTPDGGRIDVRAEIEGDRVAVHVADTGCGIAPEEREKIFDAYYSNRHGKQQSSGLGLYISSEILKRHGGSIRVESEVGRGADFILQLPLAPEAPSPKM